MSRASGIDDVHDSGQAGMTRTGQAGMTSFSVIPASEARRESMMYMIPDKPE